MGNSDQGETVTIDDRSAEVIDEDSSDSSESASKATEVRASSGDAVMPSGAAVAETSGSVGAGSVAPSGDVAPSGGVGGSGAAPSTAAAGSSRPSRGSVRDLEEEGEVAADYLEELLDIVDVDGDIDIDVENGRASLAIVAEGGSDRSLRRLVGANGEVLEALQELTRLAVQASTGERSRLMLDVAGHRAQRRKVLTDRAKKACQEVKSTGKALSLEPMSAFERKIVHDVVADAGLNSESEGVDPQRHVVVLPAS
jgi:spoIIIJ-associated protein